MKSALQFHPLDDKHFILDYALEFDEGERRMFKSRSHQISVNFSAVAIPFPMFDRQLKPCGSENIACTQVLDMTSRWSLETAWKWIAFKAEDLRNAFVLGRQVQHLIEDTLILAYPMAPAIGFTKTFDVKFEIPREIRNFESYRRSIVVR